jgi:hypothetical protein
MVSLFLSPTR